MTDKTPREEASPQEEVDYNTSDGEDNASSEAKEGGPRRVSPHKIDHDVQLGKKGPERAAIADGLRSYNERLARARAAGKQPAGSEAVDTTDPGGQPNPPGSPDHEVSNDADQGASEDPIDPAPSVPEWYRDIINDPSDWTREKWEELFKKTSVVSAGTESPFQQYLETLDKFATLPSQTGEDRVPINLEELQRKGVDVRGIRYLTPANQAGTSDTPCLMIHEKRLMALLSLEESLRDLQRIEQSAPATQVSLMMGLDTLAQAGIDPQSEYERATLSVFNKLRSNVCKPQRLTRILANENAYSKEIYDDLRSDLDRILGFKDELASDSCPDSRRATEALMKARMESFLGWTHAALIDGSNARIAAAHLGVNSYALHRQLYNLRLQYLSRLQRDVTSDITAARESIAALVSQEQAVLHSRINDDLVTDLERLHRNRMEYMDYARQLEAKINDDSRPMPEKPRQEHVGFAMRRGRSNLNQMYARHSFWESQPRHDDDSLMQLRD